jgi:hypothetical protein
LNEGLSQAVRYVCVGHGEPREAKQNLSSSILLGNLYERCFLTRGLLISHQLSRIRSDTVTASWSDREFVYRLICLDDCLPAEKRRRVRHGGGAQEAFTTGGGNRGCN